MTRRPPRRLVACRDPGRVGALALYIGRTSTAGVTEPGCDLDHKLREGRVVKMRSTTGRGVSANAPPRRDATYVSNFAASRGVVGTCARQSSSGADPARVRRPSAHAHPP